MTTELKTDKTLVNGYIKTIVDEAQLMEQTAHDAVIMALRSLNKVAYAVKELGTLLPPARTKTLKVSKSATARYDRLSEILIAKNVRRLGFDLELDGFQVKSYLVNGTNLAKLAEEEQSFSFVALSQLSGEKLTEFFGGSYTLGATSDSIAALYRQAAKDGDTLQVYKLIKSINKLAGEVVNTVSADASYTFEGDKLTEGKKLTQAALQTKKDKLLELSETLATKLGLVWESEIVSEKAARAAKAAADAEDAEEETPEEETTTTTPAEDTETPEEETPTEPDVPEVVTTTSDASAESAAGTDTIEVAAITPESVLMLNVLQEFSITSAIELRATLQAHIDMTRHLLQQQEYEFGQPRARQPRGVQVPS